MEQKKDICPHCGGTHTTLGKQNGHGSIMPLRSLISLDGQRLIHVICLDCGTVIRSYIEHPQDWA